MHTYKHVLVAADLVSSDDDPVAERAQEISKASGAKISLIHVVEAFYNYVSPYVVEDTLGWEEQTLEAAKQKLSELGKRLEVPPENTHVTLGEAKRDILKVAGDIGADLIIVGSHGRHGLGLLLFGSVAGELLKAANCDVLAVNVPEASA